MSSALISSQKGDYFMGQEDRLILTRIIEQEHQNNAPRLRQDKFFEVFAAEQILKSRNYDLDPDQIKSGVIGNGGDGGIDSIFLFVNSKLVRDDTPYHSFEGQQLTIDLVIIQSKNQESFSESVIVKFLDFANNCLRLSADLNQISGTLYKQSLLDVVKQFHAVYRGALSQRPSLSIAFYYASLGEHVDAKVEARKEQFKTRLQELFSQAAISCDLAGAKRLLDLFYIMPPKTKVLETSRQVPWSKLGKSYISLVPLPKLYEFITENDVLQARIFEANVRDYQGDVTVNKEIRETLAGATPEEFWWLNNGITILATEVGGAGDFLNITDPLIVNGLQTSYEIFNHFKQSRGPDERTILVRVIESKDPQGVDRIIKATNSQTRIPRVWLHATEDIHRKIESVLMQVGLFYDRRKNYYRNQGKPMNSIITLPYLSQALVAIVLQRPDDARARPTTAAERHYDALYSDDYPKDLYAKCALILKRADEYLDGQDLDRADKLNLVFYVAMFATSVALRSPRPKRPTIAGIDMEKFTDKLLDECSKYVREKYIGLGGDDAVAKGTTLLEVLKADLQQRFSRRSAEIT